MKIHESITEERILAACEEEAFGLANPGFCVACGADAEGVEPDAERYKCVECGKLAVFGAEQLLLLTTGW